MTMEAGYLTVGDGFLYASVHTPETGESSTGMLMIPPMVEERKCAYRLLFELADVCCTDLGLTVLRFDPRGTGESSGDHRDSSMASWLVDCKRAMESLREQCKGDVFLVGARFGGNVALRLASEVDVAGLVLLEPLMKGDDVLRDMVRRKQIKEMMGGGKATTDEAGLEATWTRGEAVDVDGFEIGSELFKELKTLDLLEELEACKRDLSILLCHVGGAKALTGNWAKAGALLNGSSRATCIRQKPFWGQLEYQESLELKQIIMDFLI